MTREINWLTLEIDLYTREKATFKQKKVDLWEESDASWFERGGPKYYIRKIQGAWYFCTRRSGNKYRILHELTKSQQKRLRRHSRKLFR